MFLYLSFNFSNLYSSIVFMPIIFILSFCQIFMLMLLFATVGVAQTDANNLDIPQLSEEQQDDNFYLSIKSTKPIPFYQEPNAKSSVIMQLPPNAVAIEYIGCKDMRDAKNIYVKRTQGKRGWCQIIYRGVYGWVQRQFLQKYVVQQNPEAVCDGKLNDIDKFICEDYELKPLAKQLIQVYEHAEQKAKISSNRSKNHLQELQKSQSLWQFSRKRCMGGDYYKKQECLISSYKVRITYLQAKWLLAGNAPSYVYKCGGKRFIITKFLTDLLPSVMVQDNKERLVMVDYTADTENKYFGDNNVFYLEHEGQVSLKWVGARNEVACKTQ
jgi:hypothetical protein